MPDLNSPILTGDVSGGLHTTSVDKLKGQPVSATTPTSGQTLVWDGSAWAPATPSTGGGGGANGLTYYLREDVAADAPTTNLPGTPKQLGRTGATGQTSVTSGTLTTGVWTLLGGYVSESVPIDPNITAIPGGLWDFNVWALGTANANAGTVIRAKVYTYNGTDAPTLLGTSGEQVINNVSAQFSLSVLVPQTTVQLTTRIYVEIEVKAAANNHTATLEFGDGTPSHVHTSLPLVGGTGLWKNVSGVLQSPASLLVDADVDPAAAIAQSKISGLTTGLAAKAAQTQIAVFTTSGTWTKPAGAKSVNVAMFGGGGGGASGTKNSSTLTVKVGGGGGGGGGYLNVTVSATAFAATESVIVGASGSGGAARTGDGASGNNGTAGGTSQFGSFLAVGGNNGVGTGTAGIGIQMAHSGGSASGTGTAGAAGIPAITAVFLPGGPGGGGGGGITGAGAATSGGTGGRSNIVNLAAGAGGGIGVAGGAGTNAPTDYFAVGSAGGGGGASLAANGGNGGNGGFPAAGGGGGGATETGTQSGAGGNGGAGLVVVTTYF